ncbi:two-component regulator propeller domain-containing protein [Brumimicrobium oceani]|uniref:Secretion system C-terminal sorting domain-containing protein n=1 Tax=Brumimicrobium oceani TaxID=2100725 RepID=A0A2U2X0D6_9FLAO|nr:two-component regulator propeller domain-containing protein [Brumimicrobium oceani]PWH81255.1 hypothetical protein DIT68_15790 [Brumimicrobium oceani]
MKKYLLIFSIFAFNMLNAQTENWANFTNNDNIYGLAAAGNKLLLATEGGGVAIDQTTAVVKHYLSFNTDLPGVNLTGVSSAENGNLWFSIEDKGISKYDGTQWTSYTRTNSAIPDSNFAYVRENVNGEVWMVTSDLKNLIKFDGFNWTVYNTYSSGQPALPGVLGDFVFDSNGDVWMTPEGLGLIKFDGTTATFFLINNSQIIDNYISDIAIDENDVIWLSSYLGISKFDGQTWVNYTIYNSALPKGKIKQLEIYNDEIWSLWREDSGLESGLIKFNGTNWIEYNSTNSSLPSFLNGDLQITSNGDKWMLDGAWSDSQIIQFNDSTTIYHDISNSPLKGNYMDDIDLGGNGKLWIGDSGGDKQLLSLKDNNWEAYPQSTGIKWLNVQNDITIWLGLYGGIGSFKNGNTTIYNATNSDLPENHVSVATLDSLGNMWFSSLGWLAKYDGLIWVVYDTTNSMLPHTTVNDIAVDNSNNIWLGTEIGGLIKFDGTNWVEYTTANTGVPLEHISNLEFDHQGDLWIGTRHYGVTMFDGTNWTTYNPSNSILPTNFISSLGVDNQNNIWIGTGSGVVLLDGGNWSIMTPENSGLPHDVVYDFEFDDLGNVWMGTGGGGLAVYNPNGVNLSVYKNTLKPNDYEINVYPVPFNDKLNIDIENRLIGSSLVFYDISGRKVGTFELDKMSTQITPMLNEKGMYFYNVVNDNRIVEKGKVIRN